MTKETPNHGLPYPEITDKIANESNPAESIRQDIQGLAAATERALDKTGDEIEEVSGRDFVYGADRRLLSRIRSKLWALTFQDARGFVAGGFTKSGRFKLVNPPILPVGAIPSESLNQDVGIHKMNGNTKWALPFRDARGFVAGGFRKDGVFEVAKFAPPRSRSSATRVAALGDSLTHGGSQGALWPDRDVTAWPARLQAQLDGVTVFNRGSSGAPVDELAIRIGAMPLRVRPAGGQIPGTGNVVLTTSQIIGWYPGRSTTIVGELSGVKGILSIIDGALSFSRATTGSPVTVAGNARFMPEWDVHSLDSLIIGAGRNDVTANIKGREATVADHVVATTVLIAEYLTANYPQFALWGTITRTDEPEGHARHTTITEINSRLKALYPGRFINIQKYLVEQCIYDLGLTPTPEDLANMAAKTIPPAFMDDVTHFNREAAQAIAVHQFEPYVTQKGWV